MVRLTGDRCTLLKDGLGKFGLVFFDFVCTMIRYIPLQWIFSSSGHSLHINRVLTMNGIWHKTAYKLPIARYLWVYNATKKPNGPILCPLAPCLKLYD